jgi:alkylation response protein AidB-like acyl-CoA dehydrogenase
VPPILTKAHEDLRRGVRDVCDRFPSEYWRDLDAHRRYPEEFVLAMTEAGYLGALIPEQYGGMGLDLSAACAILEEVNRSGANAGPAHAQMYTMGTLLRHGSQDQKSAYLPRRTWPSSWLQMPPGRRPTSPSRPSAASTPSTTWSASSARRVFIR